MAQLPMPQGIRGGFAPVRQMDGAKEMAMGGGSHAQPPTMEAARPQAPAVPMGQPPAPTGAPPAQGMKPGSLTGTVGAPTPTPAPSGFAGLLQRLREAQGSQPALPAHGPGMSNGLTALFQRMRGGQPAAPATNMQSVEPGLLDTIRSRG